MRNKDKKIVNSQGNGSSVNEHAQQARGSKFGPLEFLKVQGRHGSLSVVLSILWIHRQIILREIWLGTLTKLVSYGFHWETLMQRI